MRLFDGTTNNTITTVVNLPLRFPMGTSMIVDFYVTPLDSSASVILGHNWLTRYNPLIDWALGSVSFFSTGSDPPTHMQMTFTRASTLPQRLRLSDSTPKVSLVSAAAFKLASRLEGSQTFQLFIAPTSDSASAKSVSVSDKKIDLSAVPSDYHEFADVFSKTCADRLAPHRPYDLKIDLEDGASPPIGVMYSVSQSELQTLREFVDEHLAIGYICPSRPGCLGTKPDSLTRRWDIYPKGGDSDYAAINPHNF